MSTHTCPECGHVEEIDWEQVDAARKAIPPEPPVGTWVKDRFGGTHVRIKDSDGNVGWSCSPTGFYAFGKWEAMWEARGPLVECGPWGRDDLRP